MGPRRRKGKRRQKAGVPSFKTHGDLWRQLMGEQQTKPCPHCRAIAGEPCRLTVRDGKRRRYRRRHPRAGLSMCRAVVHHERCN